MTEPKFISKPRPFKAWKPLFRRYLKQNNDAADALRVLLDSGCRELELVELLYRFGWGQYEAKSVMQREYRRLLKKKRDLQKLTDRLAASIQPFDAICERLHAIIQYTRAVYKTPDVEEMDTAGMDAADMHYLGLPSVSPPIPGNLHRLLWNERAEAQRLLEQALHSFAIYLQSFPESLPFERLEIFQQALCIYVRLVTGRPNYVHIAALATAARNAFSVTDPDDPEKIRKSYARFQKKLPSVNERLRTLVRQYLDTATAHKFNSLTLWLTEHQFANEDNRIPLLKTAYDSGFVLEDDLRTFLLAS
jgi:hypothetical protein